jgi:PIN domain nuclease of toxin-antitoxin system
MRLLLDTHVILWFDSGARLSPAATKAIGEAAEVYVSAISGWEVAIKSTLGKITTSRSVSTACEEAGIRELPVLLRHAEILAELPLHHRDPFDRMLVAQAQAEGLTLVTRDPAFASYDVATIRA